MITIKQLAEQCGVSIATVSKALNNMPDVNVDTANRIREVAKQVGYLPNASARALKTNRSQNMGVIFVDTTHHGLAHEFFSLILDSFKLEAEHLGYDITFISNNIGDSPMSYLEHCRYRHCDGVVCCTDFLNPMIMDFVGSGIPLVTIDYVFDNVGAVLSDNVQGMRDLVQYIYNKGHRRIAYIHGEGTAVTRYRLASFHRVMAEYGLTVPDQYIKQGRFHHPQSSVQPTVELLNLPEPPTCIIYPDDFSYIGGMTEIESMGLRVPDDVSVAGYDGIYLSQALRPKLTTLKQDTGRIGASAARLLAEAIEHPKTYIPKRIVVPGWVQEGASVRQL